MMFEVKSGDKTYEIDAPDQNAALEAVDELAASVRQPSADQPSVGADIAASSASRLGAGVLDIPGALGDLGSLADTAGSAAAQGLMRLFGASEDTRGKAHAVADTLAGNAGIPGSEDVKNAVGFEAYQPKTDIGKTFDTWGGAGLELVPSVLASGGSSMLKKGAEEGLKAAVKKGSGDALKYGVAPAITGEAAGEATKGTGLEPFARIGAMVATGGIAGARGLKVTGAHSVDEWRAAGSQFYKDMKTAGVGVKPSSFDTMVSDAEHTLHTEGYRPALHRNVEAVLDDMKKAKGTPQSFEELDQMHRLATRQMGNIDKDTARIAGILADKIDDYMAGLKPGDLIARGDPKTAFNALMKGRDAWRKFRSGERIANLIEGTKDTLGANYTAAGQQTALRQAFKRYKWKGGVGKEHSRDYKSLAPDEKAMVNAIIRGVSVENALRLVGKFNIRNPFAQTIFAALGITGNLPLAGGMLAIGEGARRLSARGTISKAERLGEMVRGGKVTPGSWGRPPNSIFYGATAGRPTKEPE